MWDQKAGRSMGFEFVSFRNQQDAQSAINDLTGKWLGSRYIRCNWATPKRMTKRQQTAMFLRITHSTPPCMLAILPQRYSTHAEAAMAISMGNTQSFLLANKLSSQLCKCYCKSTKWFVHYG
ncbi:uncharacterized protein LOC105155615 isoform X2 [Sesamum indicum]|uniref:Uncharacterized protein LOC105155615 isoform X2 n=1 Tax=Sesamum indicum TaxID=4182 RepID=A0A8M8UUR1_SESIN|nr:uncharacterized protein LOC105155615 isoform X2 [Sesamum indicum]